MARFFAGPGQADGDVIRITGPDMHHMRHVLRMAEGDAVTVVSGDATLYTCEIEAFREDCAVLRIRSAETGRSELPAQITLFQGLPKGDKTETVIQKAVELGAYEVVPVSMKRSVVKVDPKKAGAKLARYRGIAEAAAKQSGRAYVPQVGPFMTLPEAAAYLEAGHFTKVLVPYECADGMAKSRAVLEDVRPGDRVAVFIGPEGGFEQDEVEMLKDARGQVFSLGKRILRTETAGMTVLSLLMFRLECLEEEAHGPDRAGA